MKQAIHWFSASCLWVIFGVSAGFAQQGQVAVNAISGQMLEIGINSSPQRPVIQVLPTHGVASFRSTGGRLGSTGYDVIEYVPTTGYIGNDTMHVQSWITNPFPRPISTIYVISVGPSVVEAFDDYASTPIDQTILIDVLANDQSTFGNLNLATVNAVLNGTAGIQSNQISFTPAAGFRGSASLSYSVCDVLGICDVATAQITVYDPNPSSDTLSIQVPKNGQQVVLLDDQGFPLTTAPVNGTLTLGTPHLYTPDLNYIGTDVIEWTATINSEIYTKRVEIEVLDIAPANVYAVDDEAFISKNTTAYIDALSNDVQGASLSGFAINTQPSNGTASIQNGLVVYTPNQGFAGVDEIVYRVFPPGYSGPAEYATIEILVNDLQPAFFDFYLETPKNTPLVINYPIPLSNFAFGISNPIPQHGTAAFYANIDSNLLGYDIAGDRLLIYEPDAGYTGTDVIRANYCITSTGACVALNIHVDVLDLNPPAGGWCVQDCVWPGDTDNNGVVELADLLPIGECHGAVGLARTSSSPVWMGLDAPNWSQQGMPSSNLKYIDSDGDGTITAADTSEIMANLGRYHKPYPQQSARLGSLPFVITLPFDTLYAGEFYYFEIGLGTPSFYAEDVYGFTYTLNYNTDYVQEGSQYMSYLDDSWLSYGTPSLHLEHEAVFGHAKSAFTLTNGIARTGYGEIARFEFIGDEDLIGFRPTALAAGGVSDEAEVIGYADFSISDASVKTAGGTYQVPATQVSIPVAVRPASLELRDEDLHVFPNPAADATRLRLNGVDVIDELLIYNELGAVVFAQQAANTDLQLDLSSFTSGVYFLEVNAGGKLLRRKLVVR